MGNYPLASCICKNANSQNINKEVIISNIISNSNGNMSNLKSQFNHDLTKCLVKSKSETQINPLESTKSNNDMYLKKLSDSELLKNIININEKVNLIPIINKERQNSYFNEQNCTTDMNNKLLNNEKENSNDMLHLPKDDKYNKQNTNKLKTSKKTNKEKEPNQNKLTEETNSKISPNKIKNLSNGSPYQCPPINRLHSTSDLIHIGVLTKTQSSNDTKTIISKNAENKITKSSHSYNNNNNNSNQKELSSSQSPDKSSPKHIKKHRHRSSLCILELDKPQSPNNDQNEIENKCSRMITNFHEFHTQKNRVNNSNHPNPSPDNSIHIQIMGPNESGKTSFILRFCHSIFDNCYIPSFGDEISYKNCILNSKVYKIKFEISEIITDANIFFVLFDITSSNSFNMAKGIITNKVNKMNGKVFLLGNKCDFKTRGVNTNEIRRFCKDHDCMFYEISIKNNVGISSIMHRVAELIS